MTKKIIFVCLCLFVPFLMLILHMKTDLNWIPHNIISQTDGDYQWIKRTLDEFQQVKNKLTNGRDHVFDISMKLIVENQTLNNNILNTSEKLFMNAELPKCTLDQTTLQEERFQITDNSSINDIWNVDLKGINYGGSFRPSYCIPDQNLAIIIPYRDRLKHLDILLNNLHTVLPKQNLSYTIFVVEIALPMRFNRGLLLNIGFKEANLMSDYSCFSFHDVDLIPLNEKNIYRCTDTPIHLSTGNSKFNYKLPYGNYIGGVMLMNKKQFETVNGFSNMYFGWGGEDDDFNKRITSKQMSVSRPDASVGKYFALSHGKDASNPKNPERFELLNGALKRTSVDGLNSAKYKVLSIEFRPLYTWIYVSYEELAYH